MQAIENRERRHLNKVQIVLFLISIIAIMLGCFKLLGSVALAFNEIVTALILFFGACFYSYRLIVFFVILSFLTMIQYVWTFGRMIQIHIYTGISPLFYEFYSSVFLISIIFSFVFDLLAVWYCFNAYRDFKYISFKKEKGVRDSHTRLLGEEES